MVSSERYSVYCHTCIGQSHIRKGKICQDFSGVGEGKFYRCGVVCDGHGGEDYFRSDRGSRFAAEVFLNGMEDAAFSRHLRSAKDDGERRKIIGQFIKSIITRWNIRVEDDLMLHPITEDELDGVSDKARDRYLRGERLSAIYGTTFIGFAFVGNFCFGVQIGDGRCIALSSDGEPYEPIPPDDDCFLNVTTSLCAPNAYEKFRVFLSHKNENDFPQAVLLCSDGVCDSFTEENFFGFVRLAYKNLNDGGEESVKELFDYLPALSERGSGDDMSMCILIDRGETNG